MANARKKNDISRPVGPPATTVEERNNQLVSMAFDRIEQRILNNEASAQELIFFAKQGTEREALEIEGVRRRNAYLAAQEKQLGSQEEQKAMMAEAMAAFARYSGNSKDGVLDD